MEIRIDKNRLKELRLERGLTQKQLAIKTRSDPSDEKTGVTQPEISRLEKGTRENIELITLSRLAHGLRVSGGELLMEPLKKVKGRPTHPRLRVYVSRLAALPPEGQEAAARMLAPILEHIEDDLAKSTTGNDGSGTDGGTPTRQIIPSAILNAVFQSRLHRTPVAYSG